MSVMLALGLVALGALLVGVGPTWAQQRAERILVIEIDAEPITEYWRYAPALITVTAGTRVTWLNTGQSHHTVTSADGFFDSGFLPSGQSWSLDLDTPGVYGYFCVPHPSIKGTVVVRPAI